MTNTLQNKAHKIVIVGGGAGGLELAALLCPKKCGNRGLQVTLVDNKLKHVWKPLLHEVATGTFQSEGDDLDYIAYAYFRNFEFTYGSMEGLDRANKSILISEVKDASGKLILPKRRLHYDTLIIAVGGLTNDFNIPGVKEHCVFLDNLVEAEVCSQTMFNKYMQHLSESSGKTFRVVIIGGGATGVELAAEMDYALSLMRRYVEHDVKKIAQYHISIVESTQRILPMLSEKISQLVTKTLEEMKVELLTDERVIEVTKNTVRTQSGKVIEGDLIIWSAGVKADVLLTHLDGLETNRINQLVVKQTLQTTKDDTIFAMGDCAACPQPGEEGKVWYVPPRAQAAHQQAVLLSKSLPAHIFKGKPLQAYWYTDYGTLIALGHKNFVGALMSRIARRLHIRGQLARFSYWSLYKKHQMTLWGFWRIALISAANLVTKRIRPRLKLH